uniref:Putative secreted protein n=1 Tax=Amblyomma triste TaxID=251400 RepID=A0A023GCK9_AMBTT
MKQIILGACIFGFLAFTASASVLPKQEPAIDAAFDDQLKSAAQDAIRVGEILRDVAGQLEDEDLSAEADEYFIRALWVRTKSAIQNATAKVAGAVKDAYNDAKEHFKTARDEAKRKATEKALEIMAKIFSKFAETYALEDSNSRVDFVNAMTAEIERVGLRLQKQGMALLES